MKKILFGIVVFLGAAVFCSAEGIAEEAKNGNEKADMSYAFGMVVASDLSGTGLEFNYDAFIRGLREVMEKKDTKYTMDEAMTKIQSAYTAAQTAKGEQNRAEQEAFLAENGKRPGVVTTASGLQYEVITEGTGAMPGETDTVRVNYRGTTIDGTVFDTTYDRGEPAEVPLDHVIPGWAEGIRLMKEGGKAMLYIPSDLAYGERGAGSAIGPNSALIFEVELLAIVPAQDAPNPDAPPAPDSAPNPAGDE